MSLLKKPKILILDNTTSAVDVKTNVLIRKDTLDKMKRLPRRYFNNHQIYSVKIKR